MNIRSFLLGSVTALVAASEARADDAVAVEAEPVEFIRVCDAYGAGYFFIPGTQTCMRISGYARSHVEVGDNGYARRYGEIDRNTYSWTTRTTLRFHTASETDYGPLKTLVELRSQWADGHDGVTGQLRKGFIDLGGMRFGFDDSIFAHWTGYYGNVYNDDIMSPFGKRTNVLSYTYNNGNGFSAIIGLEQGINGDTEFDKDGRKGGKPIGQPDYAAYVRGDKHVVNVLGGLKYAQSWGSVSAVVAYDGNIEEWAGKLRGDYNVNEKLSFFAMGGYKSGDDLYARDDSKDTRGNWNVRHKGQSYSGSERYYLVPTTPYGDWGGDWAVWAGSTYKFNPRTSFNTQAAYDDAKTLAASVNLVHELAPGLTVSPELVYVSWENDYKHYNAAGGVDGISSLKGKKAFVSTLYLQRSF